MPSEVEARLLVYVVALGAFFGLFALVRRRAFYLRFHMTVLSALLGACAAALIEPSLLIPIATPVAIAFGALVLLPSLALMAGRAFARGRRYAPAVPLVRAGAILVGAPSVLRNEARFYRSLAAAEAGDAEACRDELTRLSAEGALPPSSGGGVLEDVLPLAIERRWATLLDRLGESPSNVSALRALEARAAAESGDFLRAVDACTALASTPGADGAYVQAGRAVMAVAGRAHFLESARERSLPVVAECDGRTELAIARACEASGRIEDAERGYEAARRRGHGVVLREARDGLERCRSGAPRTPSVDAEAKAALDDLEARLDAQAPVPRPMPWYRQSAATFAITAFTLVISLVAFGVFETTSRGYLAAGALSAQLVRDDGQWWRLASYALLHGGWLHLVLNAASLLIVGIVLERRIGAARTLVVYLVSAFLASPASVWLNDTPIGVGASGGALGVMGALLVVVVRRRDLFSPAQYASWSRILWLSVVATAGIGIAEHEIVDNAAHAAGIVVGAAIALVYLRGPVPARGQAIGAPSRGTRWLAGALTAVLVGSAVIAAVQAPSWYAWKPVSSDGARAELPGWIRRSRDPEGLWWRPPVEVVVQLGVSPAEPDVTAFIEMVEPEATKYRPELRVERVDAGERVHVFGPHESYPESVGGRVHVIERNGAFALVLLMRDVEESRVLLENVLERVRESLAADGAAR